MDLSCSSRAQKKNSRKRARSLVIRPLLFSSPLRRQDTTQHRETVFPAHTRYISTAHKHERAGPPLPPRTLTACAVRSIQRRVSPPFFPFATVKKNAGVIMIENQQRTIITPPQSHPELRAVCCARRLGYFPVKRAAMHANVPFR